MRKVTVLLLVESIFHFIDVYPDFATFIVILVSSTLQLVIGNNISVLILSISLMLPSLIVFLPTNILMKKIFKTKRPEQYYRNIKKSSAFEGSFPSFHSQFSAGEATTYIVGIALYSPDNIRPVATPLAIVTMGLASTIVALSRVALKMHYPIDAIGGVVLGVVTGFVVSYIMAQLVWGHLPLICQIIMIPIFVILVFLLSRKQRRIRDE